MKKFRQYIIFYSCLTLILVITLGFTLKYENDEPTNKENTNTSISYNQNNEMTSEPLTPEVPELSSVTAVYGDSLAEIKLEAGFSFESSYNLNSVVGVFDEKLGDVGEYEYLLSYAKPDDIEGKYKVVHNIPVTIIVEQKQIPKPTLTSKVYTYSGEDQILELSDYDNEIMSISGNMGVDANEYTATITLKNTNYCWEDGTTEETINWEILPKQIARPTMADKVYRYTGEDQVLELIGFDNESMTISDNIGCGVDQYTTTVKLKNANYCWVDGETEDTIINWEIKKRQLKNVELIIPENATLLSETKPLSIRDIWFTIEQTGDEITLEFINGEQEGLLFNSISATNPGTYLAKVSLDTNSEWEDGTTSSFSFRWKIV